MDQATDSWTKSEAFLRSSKDETARHLADLLDAVKDRWKARVMARTSMYDVIFTLPGTVVPWDDEVRVSWVLNSYEIGLMLAAALVAMNRCNEHDAPGILDAALTQLVSDV